MLHPWIIERVKMRALREKWQLYPTVSPEQRRDCEDALRLLKGEELPKIHQHPYRQPLLRQFVVDKA